MTWTIGRKLAAGYAAVTVLLVLMTVLASWNIARLNDTAAGVSQSQKLLSILEQILSTEKDAETGQRGYLLTGEDNYLEPYKAALDSIGNEMHDARQLTVDGGPQQTRLDALQPLLDAKQAELQETIDLRRSKGLDGALPEVLTDKGKRAMDDIRRAVNVMEDDERGTLQHRQDEAADATRTTRTLLSVGVIVCVFMVTILAWVLTRSTTEPVNELLRAVQKMEKGDLRSDQLSVRANDEIGLLVGSFNNMMVSLRELTKQSQGAAENLNAAASQISASTRQQTASLTEQFEAVQETTTTMTEVAQSGAQIADKAREVGATAEASATATMSSMSAVQNTSRTMETIREQVEVVAENIVALSEKTQAIGEIITTVNDLAERSNLLAFNAAIEAASVGEEGSRFSVVANELKNLADQSKESTVQVRSILGDIQKGIHSSVMLTEEAVKRVESGRAQAEAAEQVMRQSADASQSSVRAFQQIVAATNQQQIGFDQVAVALQNIRRASEQSSQGIVQLDGAVANLSALSLQLRKAVERFQV